MVKKLMLALLDGNVVTIYRNVDGYKLKEGELWLTEDDKYIVWRCYGSSCEKRNMRKLKWLITNIFDISLTNFSFSCKNMYL